MFVSVSVQAQMLRGTVCDSITNEPLAQVTVSAYLGNNVIFRARSNNEGLFFIESKDHPSSIEFSYVGYKTKRIGVDGSKTDLGIIKLSPLALAEVSVVGSTTMNKIDKDVYLVTDEIRKGVMNAGEMLGKLPGIMYNWYNTEISVDGDKNVLLLVDGLEKPSNYIKDINPKKIKSVEVVHNPGGRYLSENYAAVIDLKLYEDYVGMDLAVNNNLNSRLSRISDWDWLLKENSSINYTHTYNKLTWYAGYDFGLKRVKMFENDYTCYPGYLEQGTIRKDNEDNIKNGSLQGKSLAGFDYKISKDHSVSGQLVYSNNNNNVHVDNDIWYGVNGVVSSTTLMDVDKEDKSNDVVGSLFYNGKINDRIKIYSDLNYNYYTSDLSSSVYQLNLFSNEAVLSSKKNYLRYNIDMTYDTEKSSLKFGYSTTWKNYHSEETKRNAYKEESDNYRNRLFSYYSYNISQKMSFSLGGAAEWVKYVSRLGTEKHFSFFPDVKFMYKPSRKINFTCQYSGSVEYPTLAQTLVNYRLDSLRMLVANPGLQQMRIHNFSARLRMWDCLTLTPSVHLNPNKHYLSFDKLGDGMVSQSYINADFKQYSIGLNYDKMFMKCFYFSGRVAYEHSRINYDEYNATSNALVGSATFMYMNNKHGLRLMMQYDKANKKNLSMYGVSISGENMLMFAAMKSFFKNRASIMLAYMPPLRFIEGENSSSISTSYYQNNRYNNSSAILRNMVMLRANIRLDYGKRTRKQAHEITVDNETVDDLR